MHSRGGAGRVPPPEYLLWEITLRCNFRCLHCAAGAGRARDDELSTDEALELCDQIAELGVPAVALMGGEPLLRKDWKLIARRLREVGVYVGLITNGFLFNEKAAEAALELGVVQVGVSLDGADPEVHNMIRRVKKAYEGAVRAIGLVNEMDIPYRTVLTSVNKHNIGQLDDIRRFLLDNTQDFLWIVNYSSPHGSRGYSDDWAVDEEDFKYLARFIQQARKARGGRLAVTGTHGMGYFSSEYGDLHDYEWKGCLAGREALGVRSNGDVVGCLVLPEEFDEGNARRRSLSEIWNDASSFPYTRRFDRRKLRGKCRGCEHAAVCMAGCTNIAYCYGRTIYEAPFCLHAIEKAGR